MGFFIAIAMGFGVCLMIHGFGAMFDPDFTPPRKTPPNPPKIKPPPMQPREQAKFAAFLIIVATVIGLGSYTGILSSPKPKTEPVVSASELQRHIFGNPNIPVPPRPAPSCIPSKCREI